MSTQVPPSRLDSTKDFSSLVPSAFGQANAAFAQANAAYSAANNSTDTWVRTQANNAYDAANSGASFANGAFDRANAAYNAANTATDTWVRTQANNAYNTANSAFTKANNALPLTGGTLTGDLTINANTTVNGTLIITGTGAGSNAITFADGTMQYTANTDPWARAQANAGFNTANSASSFANGAFTKANSANVLAQSSFDAANSSGSFANGAFDRANAAYGAANNATDTWVRNQANNAYNTANSAGSFANGAFDRVNTSFAAANSAGSFANGAFDRANAAFTQANTGGSGTDSWARTQANAAFVTANLAYNTIVAASNTAALYYNTRNFTGDGNTNTFSISSNTTANSILVFDNGITQNPITDYSVSGNNIIFVDAPANGTIIQVRELLSNIPINNADTWVRDQSNASFTTANSAASFANGAFDRANAAFNTANNSTDTWVRSQANNAYDAANSAASFANGAFTTANLKFNSSGGTISGDVSITGNLAILGNTFSVSATQIVANDTMFIMGTDNYTTDILDIGFAAHYNDGTNAHTGIIRDASTKEWHVFDGYTPEVGANNNIDINHASFKTGTLNANLKSTTISIKGIDVLPYINNAYDTANSAASFANGAFTTANNALPKSGGTVTGNVTLSTTATMIIQNTTPTISNSTGALIVDGGAAVKGNLWVSGLFTVDGDFQVGNQNTSGNVYNTGVVTFTQPTYFTNTTNSSTTTSGAIIVTGSAGVGGNVTVGGTLSVVGPAVSGITFSDGSIQYTANAASTQSAAAFDAANSAGSFANGAFTTANNALPKSGGTVTGNVIFSGTNANLHFSGAAARITGDFTNATLASRTMFQTSTTNGETQIYAIPNGTGTISSFSVVNNSNPTNAGILQVVVTSIDARFQSGISGSGTYLPMTFYTGGSTRLTIDTSGNANLTNNLALTGGNTRITSDFSNAILTRRTMFQTSTTNGTTNIYAVPNGTATGASWAAFNNSDPTNASYINIVATITDHRITSGLTGTGSYLPFTIYTGGSERFRIDTSGNANIPGTLIIQSTTASTSNTTGAFEVVGGVGIQGNVYTGAITVTGSTANGITFADGTTQYTANVLDPWVRNTANASFVTANSAGSFANAAFDRANAAFNTANTGGGATIDSWARDTANAAFIQANAAFNTANSGGGGGGTTDAWARDTANASYVSQNTTAGFANSAYAHANAAYAAANTGGGGADTWARDQANAAFAKANSEIIIFAVTDDTSNLTVSSARASFRAPCAMTLTAIPRASLNVASTSGLVNVDIKLAGTTILGSNKLTIDATEKTSTTALTATTLVTTAISDDAEITVDILSAGTGAKGLKLTFYYND